MGANKQDARQAREQSMKTECVQELEEPKPGADLITQRRGRSQMPREGMGDRLKHSWKQRLSRLLWEQNACIHP